MHPPPPPLRTMMTCPSASNGQPDKNGYGYFDPGAGPVLVDNARLAHYRTDMSAVIKSLLSNCDMRSSHLPPPLIDDILWELGVYARPGRTQRVSIWFARRLHVPEVWDKVRSMMRSRPASGLRIVLTSTLAPNLPAEIEQRHLGCSCVRRARTWRGACCGRRHTCRTDQQSIRPRRRTHPTCGGVRLGGDQRQTICFHGREATRNHAPARHSISIGISRMFDGRGAGAGRM